MASIYVRKWYRFGSGRKYCSTPAGVDGPIGGHVPWASPTVIKVQPFQGFKPAFSSVKPKYQTTGMIAIDQINLID